MIVFCTGMPRSASTWSFNVSVRLISHAHPNARLYTGFDDDVTSALQKLEGDYDHLILKCHRLDSLGRTLVRLGAAKAVYTHREPADATASYMVMFGGSFDDALAAIVESIELYGFHRRCGNAALIPYETIIGDPLDAVVRVQNYLGLEMPADALQAITTETSLEAMRQAADRVGEESDKVVSLGSLRYDRHTLLHRNHIRHGGIGYGRTFLSAEQQTKLGAAVKAALSSNRAPSELN